MRFIVAYDIADPKRLKRVADVLERVAQRVQKSVFVFSGTTGQLDGVQHALLDVIDPHEDCVQAWPLLERTTLQRRDLGEALPGTALCVIASPHGTILLEDHLQ